MSKICQILSILTLGIALLSTGCNISTQTIKHPADSINKQTTLPITDTSNTNNLTSEETINLYGFEIPYCLVLTPDNRTANYEDGPYPHMTGSEDMLIMYLNTKYPENGGDTYRLENFLNLKFDQETVTDLMDKFKSGKSQSTNFDDGTYILFSTATDDTRVVCVGNIEDKPNPDH